MIQPTLINLHPNEYSQEFYCYPFVLKLDRCVRCFNAVNDVSNRVCVPSKTEDLKLSMFNMITVINQSYVCKYKFDGKKCNSDQWLNNDKYRYECKKHHVCEKDLNPAACSCENGKYLASIMNDSAITCNEIMILEVVLAIILMM